MSQNGGGVGGGALYLPIKLQSPQNYYAEDFFSGTLPINEMEAGKEKMPDLEEDGEEGGEQDQAPRRSREAVREGSLSDTFNRD